MRYNIKYISYYERAKAMKLTDKERDGKILLLDGTKYVCLAAASAAVALLISGEKKGSDEKSAKKHKKKFSKRYSKVHGILSGAADKAALKWLEADVKAHPDKYLKRDKGIHIDMAEMIDI